MAKNIHKIADALGAKIGTPVSDVVGGAFGMSRLAKELSLRLTPSRGRRPGRPTDPSWRVSRKVPMSEATFERLEVLPDSISIDERKVSPMQVAAQLLEEGLERMAHRS